MFSGGTYFCIANQGSFVMPSYASMQNRFSLPGGIMGILRHTPHRMR